MQWRRFVDPEWIRLYLGSIVDDAVLGLGDEVGFVSWEEDELAEVVGESGLVGLEAFLASVLASVVDVDANRSGELHSESDCLDLSKGESLSQSRPVAVSNGLASDGGPEAIEGTRRDGVGLASPGCEPSALPSGLVEPYSDVSLPVLPEMDIGDHVVMLYHWY